MSINELEQQEGEDKEVDEAIDSFSCWWADLFDESFSRQFTCDTVGGNQVVKADIDGFKE